MKRFSVLFAGLLMTSLFSVGTASAGGQPGAPGQGKITCFSGGGGVCTLNSGGAKGTATLDVTAGGAAGVYIPGYNSSFYGVRLSQIKALSFTYTGVAPGPDPHQSIPIDTNGDGNTEYFVFVSASTCNNGAGLVDIINDTTCTIYGDGGATYPNWNAFATGDGTNFRIALLDNYTFVIADSSLGSWVVGNVTVGKPGK